jgi:hypothetical protein
MATLSTSTCSRSTAPSSRASWWCVALCIAVGVVIPSGMFASGVSLETMVRRALFSAAPGWMHVIHPDHVRANSDGTGAVTVGGPVGWVEDLSGNANHSFQATAAARATLQQDAGGRYYLQTDGADDFYRFTDVPASPGQGRILAVSANEESATNTHVFICPRTGGNGYLGRITPGWYYRSDSAAISSGISSAALASVIASIRGGAAYLQVGSSEFSGTADALAMAPFGALFRYDASGGSAYAKTKYYGGLLNVREPSVADVALVKRWLDKLRGA